MSRRIPRYMCKMNVKRSGKRITEKQRNVKKKIKKNVDMNVRMSYKFKPILFLYQASFFGVRQIPEAL